LLSWKLEGRIRRGREENKMIKVRGVPEYGKGPGHRVVALVETGRKKKEVHEFSLHNKDRNQPREKTIWLKGSEEDWREGTKLKRRSFWGGHFYFESNLGRNRHGDQNKKGDIIKIRRQGN